MNKHKLLNVKYLTIFYGLFLAALIIAASFAPSSLAQENTATDKDTPERYVDLRYIPEMTAIQQDDVFYIAVEQNIHPGWHTYWQNPGDSGEPLRVEWSLPEGVETGDILWPTPKKISVGPLTSFGYEGKVVTLHEFIVTDELPDGPLTFTADSSLLVCEEICIPEFNKHDITFNAAGNIDNSPFISEVFNELPIELEWDSRFFDDGEGNFVLRKALNFQLFLYTLAEKPNFQLFPEQWGLIDNTGETTFRITQEYLEIVHPKGDRDITELENISGIIGYTDREDIYRGVRFDAFPLSQIASAPQPTILAEDSSIPEETDTSSTIANISLVKALLFALFGGLILNLMPCVFPVLSLKALKLSSLSGKELGEARIHGLLYTAGIIVSFLVFAGALLMLRATGQQIGWGFQLQNPLFVLSLSWVFFVLGLGLFGFFEIGSRLMNVGSKATQGDGYSASFFTGVLATLVATPCTAPFMGIAMGYALTQPITSNLAIFITLGFGLALPYLLLTYSPRLLKLLPKPGPWMEIFKQFMAFPIFATAMWLVWVLSMQAGNMLVLLSLSGALAISFALWVLKHKPQNKLGRAIIILFTLVVLGLGLTPAILMASNASPMASTEKSAHALNNWQEFSPETLSQLLKGDDPVFVDMTAAWCITCKVNEKIALDIESTAKIFADNNVQLLQGDWTNRDEDITKYLESYGRNGVPLYVYYSARDLETGERSPAVVLPQILTPSVVRNVIEKGDKE